MNNMILLILLAIIVLLFVIITLFIIQNNKLLKDIELFKKETRLSINQDLSNHSIKELEHINELEKNLKSLWHQKDILAQKMISDVNQEVNKVYERQIELKELSNRILKVEALLNDKKSRGIFGENRLYHLLDMIYPKGDIYQRQFKLSNGNICDAIVKYKDEYLVIDAKFPLENYNRLYDETGSIITSNRTLFRRDLIKHIDDIANKYLIKNETSDIAIMFVPSEAIFMTINDEFNEVIEYGYQRSIYLTSPSSLLAYLNLITNFYLDYQKNQNVKLIQTEYIKLESEFKRYNDRLDLLKKDFDKISKDFYDITITGNKLFKRFETIKQLDLKGIIDEQER